MAEKLNVVVHNARGELIKGSTQDFHPDRPMFRIVLPTGVDTVPVKMAELKAVFFVKQLDGAPTRRRAKSFSVTDGNRGNGRPVAVRFHDGELLVGYTHSFNPERQGFFMLPVGAEDNNLRVFVLRRAVKVLKLGADAEAFAREATGPEDSRAA